MNNHKLSSPRKEGDQVIDAQCERNHNSRSPRMSPNRSGRSKETIVDTKIYGLNPYRFIKHSPYKGSECLPPKSGPFQRTNRSRSRDTSIKDKSTSNVSAVTTEKGSEDNKQSRTRTQSVSKVTELRKKISNEIAEKQKWKQQSQFNQEKLAKMSNELTKMKEHNKYLQDQIDRMIQVVNQKQKQLNQSQHHIEQLNKTIKNQNTQINILKSKDSQIEQLKNQNKKVNFDNQSLQKTINALRTEIQKKNLNNLQEQILAKSQNIVKLQRQIDKLKGDLKEKDEQNKMHEENLRQMERVLYQKESDLKKITINLSFMGRKTAMSIEDIRCRKDSQIKQMRDRYHKVSKDLKDLKDTKLKLEKKKSLSKDIPRKVKSSKYLRCTSESEQFTLQISSET